MKAPGIAVLALVAFGPACRRATDATHEDEPRPAAPVAAPRASAAADHLAPGELVEGAGRAFGLVLPRALEVRGSFVDVVYAGAPVSVHSLAEYFRARLFDGSVHEGPSAATFEHVKVAGQPGRELLVRVATAPGGSNVEIRDSTPSPASPLPDEASRWRQVGLTPDGRLADPSHLD